ncbi:MAG: hypothetical protein ABIY55_14465 [Kofleriaceae bacterium]
MLIAALTARVDAEPLVVVVRDGGDATLAVARLRGQVADLEIELTVVPGVVEPALDGQLVAASRLAASRGARAVVWFVARGQGLAVAIATPGDHRLFVREIPPADASAVAEAAAVAARGALRAIGEGGTIGVEVAPRSAASVNTPSRYGLELAVGWQIALDGGADVGAQAIAQRTSVTRGAWAGSLALSLGPALRHEIDPALAPGLTIELSRSTATLGIERRFAGLAVGGSAGVLVAHRTTVATSSDLAPTPAATTTAFVIGPELRWRWRPGGGHVGIEALAGLDVVIGAPELAIAQGTEIVTVGTLRSLQPRFALSIFAGLP